MLRSCRIHCHQPCHVCRYAVMQCKHDHLNQKFHVSTIPCAVVVNRSLSCMHKEGHSSCPLGSHRSMRRDTKKPCRQLVSSPILNVNKPTKRERQTSKLKSRIFLQRWFSKALLALQVKLCKRESQDGDSHKWRIAREMKHLSCASETGASSRS